MAIPLTPPPLSELFQAQPGRLAKVFALQSQLDDGRYLHWDEIRHRTPPDGFTVEEWWAALKLKRSGSLRELPFKDRRGVPFKFGMTDCIVELLHKIDMALGGRRDTLQTLATSEMRDRYLVSGLIEEAITSSQMEGASTTRKVAADMLRSGRPPRTKSEQMIVNNYRAMAFIRRQERESLTPSVICELQRVLTEETLDDPQDAGRVQRVQDQRVNVIDNVDGAILHAPPLAVELPERMLLLCAFANGETGYGGYLHPVVRAVLLHFMLAYDHPFADGNGRTARALFYWGMLHQDYELAEFLSISRVLRKAQAQYKYAFLHTETDENDTSYFVIHQLRALQKAIDELRLYLDRKTREIADLERRMRTERNLNHRQRSILAHAMRHPGFEYTFESHRASHSVAFATARSDLLGLADAGLLMEGKRVGKTRVFIAPMNLPDIL
ncbi:MAG: Fic family protein [Arenimonas sp.]|uniref:Fic family protein n=1 Tax=Arenimonas sp. TaxID=1872635 RepID=UPI0025BEEF59|nr:Fic family protein [Arenimonas sp.]MBW8366423.1 Fic family protein [Arenimonas sp.]